VRPPKKKLDSSLRLTDSMYSSALSDSGKD
jgi:hypothetical protein